jgi:putative ABC transport system permease protein
MAIPGARGPTARAARATLLAAAVAVAAAVAALTVAASLTHLLGTPRLYGQTWDFGSLQGPEVTAKDVSGLRADPAITAALAGEEAILDVNGHALGVAAYDPVKRTVTPTVVAGRAPTRPDEVMLGTKTFGAWGAHLGDRVAVRRGSRTVRMTVVGRGIVPETSFLSLGEGAVMTFAALKRVIPAALPRRLLIGVTEGPGREATLQRLEQLYYTPRPPVPRVVRDVAAVRVVPLGLAAVVALLAAATLAWTLLLSVRRGRRELAILETLGFTRRQVRALVAWHATTVGAIALAVGVPLGWGIGRWIWNVVAAHLGVASEPVTPGGSLILVVPAVLLLVNLVAAVPGGLAARTRPAVVLRAE